MVSCFSVERRVIFPLRNVKCKDYVSCQVVETRHLRNLHTENEVTYIVDMKKENQEKAITKFSPHVFKSPTFNGSNDSYR